METTLFDNYCPVNWWIDRMGNMEFIHDQTGGIMNPAFYWHMIKESDKTGFNISALT